MVNHLATIIDLVMRLHGSSTESMRERMYFDLFSYVCMYRLSLTDTTMEYLRKALILAAERDQSIDSPRLVAISGEFLLNIETIRASEDFDTRVAWQYIAAKAPEPYVSYIADFEQDFRMIITDIQTAPVDEQKEFCEELVQFIQQSADIISEMDEHSFFAQLEEILVSLYEDGINDVATIVYPAIFHVDFPYWSFELNAADSYLQLPYPVYSAAEAA